MLEKVRSYLDRNKDKFYFVSLAIVLVSLLALFGALLRVKGNETYTSLELVIIIICGSIFGAALLMMILVKLITWVTNIDRLKKIALVMCAIVCAILIVITFATFNWWLLIGVVVSGAFTAYGFEKW